MTLSRQSTGTARNFKFREISESSKSRNPQNLGIPTHKIHKLRNPQKIDSNVHVEIFEFPKLAPGRVWGVAGMVGHAETCSKHPSARLALRSLPIHDRGVVPQKSWNFKILQISEFRNPRNLGILQISEFRNPQSRHFSTTFSNTLHATSTLTANCTQRRGAHMPLRGWF